MKKLDFTKRSTWITLLIITFILLSGIPFLIYFWPEITNAASRIGSTLVALAEVVYMVILFYALTIGLMFPIMSIGKYLINLIRIIRCTISCIKDLPEPI